MSERNIAIKNLIRTAEYGVTVAGGYPLFAIMKDGGTLCPKCVKEERGRIYRETVVCPCDPEWAIKAVEVNWEDNNLECDNCNEDIDPAYPSDYKRISKRFGPSDVVEREDYKLIRYTLGSHFASYLVNADDSGLEEGEREGLDDFLKSEGLSSGQCCDCADCGFTNNPDFGLPGDCQWFIFRVDTKKE